MARSHAANTSTTVTSATSAPVTDRPAAAHPRRGAPAADRPQVCVIRRFIVELPRYSAAGTRGGAGGRGGLSPGLGIQLQLMLLLRRAVGAARRITYNCNDNPRHHGIVRVKNDDRPGVERVENRPTASKN
nr:hypothetical protein GCM10017745_46010 [Saccharothrix mutabilis subsp. capreolus]